MLKDQYQQSVKEDSEEQQNQSAIDFENGFRDATIQQNMSIADFRQISKKFSLSLLKSHKLIHNGIGKIQKSYRKQIYLKSIVDKSIRQQMLIDQNNNINNTLYDFFSHQNCDQQVQKFNTFIQIPQMTDEQIQTDLVSEANTQQQNIQLDITLDYLKNLNEKTFKKKQQLESEIKLIYQQKLEQEQKQDYINQQKLQFRDLTEKVQEQKKQSESNKFQLLKSKNKIKQLRAKINQLNNYNHKEENEIKNLEEMIELTIDLIKINNEKLKNQDQHIVVQQITDLLKLE